MTQSFYFICYSSQDGEDIALRLADQLVAGPPSIPVWIDRRNLQPGIDRYQQLLQALNECQGVLYLMTNDSVDPFCPCRQEWLRALKYKKPIIRCWWKRVWSCRFSWSRVSRSSLRKRSMGDSRDCASMCA